MARCEEPGRVPAAGPPRPRGGWPGPPTATSPRSSPATPPPPPGPPCPRPPAAGAAAGVAGPGLAGVRVALAGPGSVIALDAASYGVSVLALASLRLPAARARATGSCLEDLRDGWAEFRGRPWLVITTVQ